MKSIQNLVPILFLILLCSWNSTNHSAIMVSGIVTDAENGDALPGVNIVLKGSFVGVVTNIDGEYEIEIAQDNAVLVFSYIGYKTLEIPVEQRRKINVAMEVDGQSLSEIVVTAYHTRKSMDVSAAVAGYAPRKRIYHEPEAPYPVHNTEEYASIEDNAFLEVSKNPLSTFSIDVDNASYSNMRRFINNGQQPPKDAIRIEEMINYFNYDYPQPKNGDPFSLNTEISECPWNSDHQLVHIGLQGKKISTEDLPPSNLVFLIDVSGSMQDHNKLPLLKSAFKLLVNELREQDDVSLVVYAGAVGVVLPSTPGNEKKAILEAIENLEAGGSTAGDAGIEMAYDIATKNFKKDGNNRVIIATDGDFNVGMSSNAAMERLIEEKRESGVFLTVLGFGMGNYKDSKMEGLADKGNGNYAYVDNILEAKKVFVNEFGGTLFTIAKDVKLQVEFNPTKVKGYRLIGYENRALNDEDFNDDKKDAGELGAGHSVTALYEVIPANVEDSPYLKKVDDLKYQEIKRKPIVEGTSDEILTIKLRYKTPDGNKSKLMELPVKDKPLAINKTSDNYKFSAAVAAFGMVLRDSEFKGSSTYASALRLANESKGADEEGYRAEFINLIKASQLISGK